MTGTHSTADTGAAPVSHDHGGSDALGVPAHDFSTNRNSCGPCPWAVQALLPATSAQYPDPAYTALRAQLGVFHGVDAARIVLAGSASEFIFRLTSHIAREALAQGRPWHQAVVGLPAHSYGDYERAAQLWQLPVARHAQALPAGGQLVLHWACEPSSPLGHADPALAQWRAEPEPAVLRIIDRAYAPLLLETAEPLLLPETPRGVWQLWTPNKALGMTGVRAAYAIAPDTAQAAADVAALQRLAPSWPVGSHGVVLLQAWMAPEVQQWLARSRTTLRQWKAAQIALCERLGWSIVPGSAANYFVARPAWAPEQHARGLAQLRSLGVKLRDATPLGLPGAVRLGVLPPASQAALEAAWRATLVNLKST